MTANLKNTVSPIVSAISAAMSDAIKSENRQTATIAAAFNSTDVVFSSSRVAGILRTDGADRTEQLDALLCDLSDEFDDLAGKYDLHKEEKKQVKGNKTREKEIAFAMAEKLGKMKAAREFITRVLKSLHYLYSIKAVSVTLTKKNRLAVVHPSNNNPKVNVEHEYTGRELVASAAEVVAKLKPAKKTDEKKEKQSIANGMKSAFESSLKYLDAKENTEHLDNMSDELETKSNQLLLTLLKRKFADDNGTIDWKLVAEFYGEKGHGNVNVKTKTAPKTMTAKEAEELTKKMKENNAKTAA